MRGMILLIACLYTPFWETCIYRSKRRHTPGDLNLN